MAKIIKDNWGEILFSIALFVIFISFPVQTHTYDGLVYLGDVTSGQLSRLFHPHHVLYSPLCFLFWQLSKAFSASIEPLQVMRFLGALASVFTCFFVRHTLLIWRIEKTLSWLLSIFAVLTYGPWRFTSISEPYALHIMLVSALFFAASRIGATEDKETSSVGFVTLAVLATLNMQTAFLFIPSALLLAFWPLGQKRRAIKTFILYALLTGASYLICGLLATKSLSALPAWFGKYAIDQRWWNPAAHKLVIALFAASDVFWGRPEVSSLLRVLCSIASLPLFLFIFKFLRHSLKISPIQIRAIAFALLAQFGLYYQFDAGSPCYWTIVPMLTVLLLAIPLSMASKDWKRIVVLNLAILVLLTMTSVFLIEIRPQSSKANYRPYYRAKHIEKIVGSDTLWVHGGNLDEQVFLFFTPMKIRSIHDHLLAKQSVELSTRLTRLREILLDDLKNGNVYIYCDLYNGAWSGILGLDNKLISPIKISSIFGNLKVTAVKRGKKTMLWKVQKP